MNKIEYVKAFFAQWNDSYASMRASFGGHFTADCRWDQRPFALTVGPAEAVRFMDRCRRFGGIETIDVELSRIAVDGDTVLCARVDHLYRRNGSLIAAVPVAGVLELRDGRIAAWREYVDAFGVVRQAAASGVRQVFGRLGAGGGA